MHSFKSLLGMTAMLLATTTAVLGAPAAKVAPTYEGPGGKSILNYASPIEDDVAAEYEGPGGKSILNYEAPAAVRA
ncbi:hypothetical protein PG990_009353 [Apiospora arundinis]